MLTHQWGRDNIKHINCRYNDFVMTWLEPQFNVLTSINHFLRPTSVHDHFDMISAVSVYAKPHLSQVNVRQNVYATDRNFGFTCHNDRYLLLYVQKLECVLWGLIYSNINPTTNIFTKKLFSTCQMFICKYN